MSTRSDIHSESSPRARGLAGLCAAALLGLLPLGSAAHHPVVAQETESEAQQPPVTEQEKTEGKPASQDRTEATQGGQQEKEGEKPPPAGSSDSAPDDEKKAAKPDPSNVDLLQLEFAKSWKLFAAEEGVKVQDVWAVRQDESGMRVLVCSGKPKGYLRTQAEYENYRLSFEFRFPVDENGNSGVLLHVDGKDKIWPDGIQVQLHRPDAGSIFPSGNRKTPFTIGAHVSLGELSKWNKCEITAHGPNVAVKLNDKVVGPLTGCVPAKGFIALQSEGSEVHFRKLMIVRLPAPPQDTTLTTDTETARAPAESGKSPDATNGGTGG